METPNLIIEILLFALVVAGLSSISSAHNKIKVLEKIRGEAAEYTKSCLEIQHNINLQEIINFRDKEIEALEHTVGLKSETIEKLLAEIKYNKALYKLAGLNPAALTAAEILAKMCDLHEELKAINSSGEKEKVNTVPPDEETFECAKCGKLMTSDDQAEYNQFSQIDFNCCQSCADSSQSDD